MDLTKAFASPHALHAFSVHLPISLGLVGLPFVFVALWASSRWPRARIFAGAYYFFASLAAVAATLTGLRAASTLVALANEKVEAVVAQHQLLGFATVVLPLVTSIFLVVSHFRARSGGKFSGGVALFSAIALAVVILYDGSSGGRLVYGFGIGTPVAGVDGLSGATLIVGAYRAAALASNPSVGSGMDDAADAKYTPHTRSIDSGQAASMTFRKDIAPILERRCVKCHHGKDGEAGLDLSTKAGMLKGGDYAGAAVVPGVPDQSPVVLHLRGIYQPKMPKDAEELSEDELHTIRMWIFSGAKGE